MLTIRSTYRDGNRIVVYAGAAEPSDKREHRSDVSMGNDNNRLFQPPSRGASWPPATDEARKEFYSGLRAK